MSRSKWKNPIVNKDLKLDTYISRSSQILNEQIGKNIFVHNGKEFKKVRIIREKVGYKMGFFSGTRSYPKKIVSSKGLKNKIKSKNAK